MASLRHTHAYERFRRNKKIFYRCTDPHCTHYMEKELVLGKACKCPICGNDFVLSIEDLKRKRPRCLICSNTAAGQQARAAARLIEEIFTPCDDPMRGEM